VEDLRGKVALITGASGGIGSETARLLGARGARLVITDLPGSGLGAVAADLLASGIEVIYHEADIQTEELVIELMRVAHNSYETIDVLANIAGATSFADRDTTVAEMDVDVWDEIVAINLRGPMLTCKHGIPLMSRGGSIINISSATAFAGDLGNVAYASAKAGLNTLTRYIATVYGENGIRCNALAPGIILTPRSRANLPEAMLEIMLSNTTIARLGEPRDVAEAVCFLASDASTYITGQIVALDGGHSAHQPHVAQLRTLMRG
jgi:NAD(P)-dependent dehydrogenase (short-subunit alcohol dehydrogenase family)